MFRVTLFLAVLTASAAQATLAGPRLPTHQGGLSQYFVVVDGTLDWIAPPEAPPVTVMVEDFWTLWTMVAPTSAPLLDNQTLAIQSPPPGLTIRLRVLHVPTTTLVCDAPLPLTTAAARVLLMLGCVTRTDAENQRLQVEAVNAFARHLARTPTGAVTLPRLP